MAALVAPLALLVVAPALVNAAPAPGRSGRVIGTSTAPPASRLAPSGRTFVLRYTTRTVRGRIAPATGLVLIPRGHRPRGGWPVVVYGHMTTGAADRCAPTRGTVNDPEKQKMQQGDDTTRALLRAGVMVLRPDYEGLGVPGPHPYLYGPSLAQSMVDMLAALHQWRPRLTGTRWVVSGHSEGAVAALWTAARNRRLVPGMRLTGVSAFTPVTRMETLVSLLRGVPVTGGPIGELVGLAALMLKGIAATDPAFEQHLLNGGLSAKARSLWPQLEQRCLAGLSLPDSWGGLAPSQVAGPGEAGAQTIDRLVSWLAKYDVRTLKLRPGLPVRIDLGLLDTVAPFPFTEDLAQVYRRQGNPVTVGRWLANHSPTDSDAFATPAAVAWMLARLRG